MRVGYACLTACALILCATHADCSQLALPESTLQPIDVNTTSTCFGLNAHFRPSCPASGTVIAMRELTVGSKLNTSGCPVRVQELPTGGLDDYLGNSVNQSCCRFETGDCTFEYLSHDQNMPPFKHFRYCTGLNTCSETAETIQDNTQCLGAYMDETSYMYAQYYCINETRIADMCSSSVSKTLSGSAFYLESPNYPNNITSGSGNCACSVQSSVCQDTIDVYTVHVEMMSDGATCKQRLTVNDSGTILEWDCNSQTMFDITVASTRNYITVELENNLTSDGGYAWLGFKGNLDNADLVINCPPVPENCTNAPTTIGAQSGDEGGVPLGAIIGAILGLLLLIAVLVACCCCYCKKKKKKNQVDPKDEKDPDEKKLDDSLRFRTREGSAAPVNTHFPVGGAASHRGHETRYIMEHSGVNGIEPDNDDAKKPPARLPPISPGSTHPPPSNLPPPIGLMAPPIIPPSSKNGAPRIITKPSSADHPPPDYHTQSPKTRPPAVFHPDKVGEDDFVNERSITSRDIHLQPSVPVSNSDGDDGQKTKKKKHRKHKKKSKAQAAERSDDAGGEMQQTDDQDDVAHTQLSEGQSVDERNA